ncbi:hypothetical protein GT755_19445 [Herbidospora sp. NEAU-GS84]|uniref:Uncharacterized protein n=1 Tax=Herbidospora solisilvae TaxID=2696284 RepID=A0A7C9J4V1_9ACTN|nr:hypothetical protein [Herbidospora solisilvae]NAS23860.1 hypothetical protein [Herbidospora solisilvae]
MPDPDNDLLRKALAKAVAGLPGSGRLSVVEVAADGLTSFKIIRDDHGVPRGRRWHSSWTELGQERAALLRAADVDPGDDTLLVCSSLGGSQADEAFEWLRAARPDAPTLRVDASVAAVITEVLRDDPLTRSYDLVVLRPRPDGTLELATVPLFPVQARPGATMTMTLHCEQGGPNGTAFAVVTWQGQEPLLLSVASGALHPGTYNVTAELRRPGRVQFSGLPPLTDDHRGWAELIDEIPARLPVRPSDAGHLICAIEVCGAEEKVAERVGRARQVVSTLSGRPGLSVSVVAYGAHSFDRAVKDSPVEVRAWRVDVAAAQDALDELEERGAITQGYPYHPHAAQVEDMLVTVDRRLSRDPASSVALLTIGDRPPHPPKLDTSRVLPCPHRHDWRAVAIRLEQSRHVVFGAIVDYQYGDRLPRVWRQLGSAALANFDALDIRGLISGLGLVSDAVPVPFPLIDVEY